MYAAYLRKSREDLELEKNSGVDTLQRHRDIIQKTAEYMNITIDKWFEEVISGETISARPKIQQLLREIEQGLYEGVLVVDVDRLARGDTADQSRISKCFSFSETKIITPTKVYDPNNEADEEYFEFGLFMSRREYKIINRRLNRGRLASVMEGKWVCSICPYGWTKEKLKGQKGYKLIPFDPEYKVLRLMYDMKLAKKGSQFISDYLNNLGIKSRTGKEWTYNQVDDIIANPVNYGMIRWNYRKMEQKMVDGIVYTSRPVHNDCILVKGLHDGVVTKEEFDIANADKGNKRPSVRKDHQVHNPLMGLVKCSVCGRTMQRRNYRSGYVDGLVCPRSHCKNVGSHLYLVEEKILESLKQILKEYKNIIIDYKSSEDKGVNSNTSAITTINNRISKLKKQLSKAYDLLEQEVYDNNTFLERSRYLNNEIEKLQLEKKNYQPTQKSQLEKMKDMIPNIEKVLDSYNNNLTPEEKNKLLSSIISNIDYLKFKKGRGYEDSFSLKITIKL